MAGEHEERTGCDREERNEENANPFCGHVAVRTPMRALRLFVIVSTRNVTQSMDSRAATMAAEVKLSNDMEEKGGRSDPERRGREFGCGTER